MTGQQQIIRIFISSPGDVSDERDKARRVIDGLQRQYGGVTLQPVLWEDLALPATASFQQSIDFLLHQQPIDIAVFILWTRLGSPLGTAITRPDGTPYRSGTEREFDLMLAAFEQSGKKRPLILAYARTDETGFRQSLTDCPGARLEELFAQRKLAESFIREQFYDAEGRNLRAVHSYREPVSFAQRLHTHLRQVLEELLGLDAAPRWLEAPYRGLEFFDCQHAAIFHGRDEETCDLLQRLRDQEQAGCAFAVIVGASGSGKSSLARAGVAAALTQHAYDEGVKEWRPVTFVPSLSGDLCCSLASALGQQLPELRSSGTALDDIGSGLVKDATLTVKLSVVPAFVRAAENARGAVRILLVLDQMEELWTDRRITAEDRERFLEALEALARSRHVAVLATLRSDFYPHAQLSPTFLRLKGERGHCDLLPPGSAALQRLITEPARLAGLRFERDERTGKTLDEVILQDASRDPSALPLLQYALSELYDQRDEGARKLTFAAYQELGGVEGALGMRAAQIFQGLPIDACAALPEILPLLVTVDIAGEQAAIRRRAPLTDLTATPARRELTESLIAARFLTTDRRGDTPIAGLAHEALLRRWEQIAAWVTANRERLRLRARVEQNQQRWEQQNRDASLLLTPGLPLEEGRRLLIAATELLPPETATYIRESIARDEVQESRKRRRRRAIMAGMTILTVLALIGGAVAWRKAGEASTAADQAKAATNEANSANGRNLALLHSASMADHASAKKAWQEGSDAQRKGKWAASIGHASKWHEAVALWVRALELEPANVDAGYWLYDTLCRSGHANGNAPRNTLRHEREVRSASFSPDGKRVVTASADHTARIWDVATGQPLGVPLHHDEFVYCASFSPDGTRVVSASADHTARIWDAATGKPLGEPLRHDRNVVSASFSADGTRVVTASWDKTARIWDAGTGKPWGEPLRHNDGVNSASFSLDGTRVVTACWDQTARIWDAATAKPLGDLLRHDGDVFSASFSPDGTRVVSASRDKTARIWDAATGTPLSEPLRHDHNVVSASFSPDGTRVVTASADHTARIWDAATGKPLGEPLHHDDLVFSASFSPDGTRVVTASWDHTARMWDAMTGTPLGEPLRHEKRVISANFSPDGTRVVTASDDHTARIWDAATGQPLGEPLRHDSSVTSGSFSPDGVRVVTAGWDDTARIWDAATGTPLGEPLRHDAGVHSAIFSPDGTRVVTVSGNEARIWNAATGTPLGEPLRHDAGVHSAIFSPDGTRVVTVSGNEARIWDAAIGKPLGEPLRHHRGVHSAILSPDGTRVVTVSGNEARIWDAAIGKPLGEPLRHHRGVNSASFSPDGTRVVTASWDHTARMWDAMTGQPLGEPLPHNAGVNSASFGPDGTRVVTVSGNEARIWDAATGRPWGAPLRHDGDVNSASFSPDGTLVVTASYDHTARIWDAATGKPLGEARRHDDLVVSAIFSPDGTRVVTASRGEPARIWEVPSVDERQEIVQISREIRDWAQAISGLQFTEDGELQTIPWDKTSQDRKESALPPGPWADLAGWLKSRGPQQTLSPKSKHTLRQVAERERDFGSRESLESALQYDPTVPLARMMLANVLEKAELAKKEGTPDAAVLARAAHWRRYDLDRLPNDPHLRTRAAEILLQLPHAKVGVGPQPITAAEASEQLIQAVPVGK